MLFVMLGALGLLLASGAASAWAGRRSERISVLLGVSGAVAACLAGLGAVLAAMVFRADAVRSFPWSMPYGAFTVGIDPLSAFFLIPTFILSGLAAIYAVGYFRPWNGRNPGRFWLFYNALIASMALVLLARNGVLVGSAEREWLAPLSLLAILANACKSLEVNTYSLRQTR